jgi:hypothetical protein
LNPASLLARGRKVASNRKAWLGKAVRGAFRRRR